MKKLKGLGAILIPSSLQVSTVMFASIQRPLVLSPPVGLAFCLPYVGFIILGIQDQVNSYHVTIEVINSIEAGRTDE
jgi:hypothetical protein